MGLSVGLASALFIFELNPFRVPPSSALPIEEFDGPFVFTISLFLSPVALQGLLFHMALHDALGLAARRVCVDRTGGRYGAMSVSVVVLASPFVHALVFFYIPSAQDEADTVLRLCTRG